MSGTLVSINGVDLYHEVHESGRPLIVLHGGVLNAETCFGAMIPRLAEAHRVIAVDLQGHGHTADTDRPVTLANLAADVVGLLDHLSIERADLFGYSLGSLVSIEMRPRPRALLPVPGEAAARGVGVRGLVGRFDRWHRRADAAHRR